MFLVGKTKKSMINIKKISHQNRNSVFNLYQKIYPSKGNSITFLKIMNRSCHLGFCGYMNNKLFNAAKIRYEAQAEEARAMLDMLFTQTVMIGEHTDILKEVDKWTTMLAEALDCADALDDFALHRREEGSQTP